MARRGDCLRKRPRRKTWTLQVSIPSALRNLFGGRTILSRELRSTSHASAIIEAAEHRAEFARQITAARVRIAAEADGKPSADGLINVAAIVGKATNPSAYLPKLRDHAESYVESRRDLREKTRGMIRASITLLLSHVGTDASVDKLTRRTVTDWSDSMIKSRDDGGQGMAPATANAHVSKCAGFWKYLKKRGLVEGDSPFSDQWQEGTGKRKRFTVAELNKLIDGAPEPLRTAIIVGLFAGLRASEIATAAIQHGAFVVAEDVADDDDEEDDAEERGKSESATRVIPIHPVLVRLKIAERWPLGLTGSEISKRFTRHRVKAGVGAPYGQRSDKTFHSLRHCFARELRRQGIDGLFRSALLGHREGQMLARYSGAEGPKFDLLRQAVEKLEYPGLKL